MTMYLISLLAVAGGLTVLPYLRIGGAAPELPLVIVVYFSLKRGTVAGLLVGFCTGIASSLLGAGTVSLNICLYGGIGCAVGYIGQWFYRDNPLTFLLMVIVSMAACYLVHFSLINFRDQRSVGLISFFWRLFIPSAVYTVSASAFIFFLFRRLRF